MGFDLDLLGSPVEDPVADVLAHYGVPGMQWGKRKAEDSGSGSSPSSAKSGDSSSSSESKSSGSKEGLSDGQKKALKYAAGGALVAGALIATAVLAKNGKIPISSLQSSSINKNSFAAEVKRMEKIPGTFAYNQKMAKIPGSLQSETARLAKIPGTLANREAQLARAAETSATMNPATRVQFMNRVTQRLDTEAQRRAEVQVNRARLIAQRAQSESNEAANAARRQIVRNQANALTRSGDRGSVQSAVDRVSTRVDSRRARQAIDTASNAQQSAQEAADRKANGPTRIQNLQNIVQAISMGRDAVNTVRSSETWNQPVTNLRPPPTPQQRERQQIVRNQQAALKAGRRG